MGEGCCTSQSQVRHGAAIELRLRQYRLPSAVRRACRFAEEYHKLALALNGRVEKHDIPLKCASGGTAAE